jgi:hypothetical protein
MQTSSNDGNCLGRRQKGEDSMTHRYRSFYIPAIAVLLCIGTFSLFFDSVHYGFVNYDDNVYVYDNKVVTKGLTPDGIAWAFRTTAMGNWHPVTWLSYMADISVAGLNPGYFHGVNIVIHSLCAALLFLLLTQATGLFLPSLLAAVVFAFHPLRVESVVWITERKDVLSMLFMLLSLIMYVRYARNRARRLYVGSLMLFCIGLMSKPMLVSFPVLLLLLDFWPLGRFTFSGSLVSGLSAQSNRKLLWEKLPFVALAAAFCLISIHAQFREGAVRGLEAVGIGVRLENALVQYVNYIRMLFVPGKLSVLYPMTHAISWWLWILCLLVILLVSYFALRQWNKAPYLLFGWLWYLAALLPVIGIITIGAQSHADRYTYIPHCGIVIALSFGLWALLRPPPSSGAWRSSSSRPGR